MKTLDKKSLFWDVKDLDPQKHQQFILERILAYGDMEDFRWAVDFYGKSALRESLLKSRTLNKKSLNFWCSYFKINLSQCMRSQSAQKQSAFWTK